MNQPKASDARSGALPTAAENPAAQREESKLSARCMAGKGNSAAVAVEMVGGSKRAAP